MNDFSSVHFMTHSSLCFFCRIQPLVRNGDVAKYQQVDTRLLRRHGISPVFVTADVNETPAVTSLSL